MSKRNNEDFGDDTENSVIAKPSFLQSSFKNPGIGLGDHDSTTIESADDVRGHWCSLRHRIRTVQICHC